MDKITTLFALHGFLGRPSDWMHLSADMLGVDRLVAVDIAEIAQPKQNNPFWNWASEFNNGISKLSSKIVMGYSLGGRLAIHALLSSPHDWLAGIIISAHAGLESQEEKNQRICRNEQLAERFLCQDWADLMRIWNDQEVFAGSFNHFERKESNYCRKSLASMLKYWSLGKQECLIAQLAKCPKPILWIVGEHDKYYQTLAHTLTFSHPLSQVKILPGAGHRVPWDCPQKFQEHVKMFINQVKEFQ